MAEDQEKTEEATGKRKQDAINEGNVPKSMEVSGAVVLLFASMYLLFLYKSPVSCLLFLVKIWC